MFIRKLRDKENVLAVSGLFMFALSTLIVANIVFAGQTQSVRGWGWAGSEDSTADSVINGNEAGFGWLSMNSSDCDTNNDGKIDVSACGVIGSSVSNYGVNIPASDGSISGYAWSEHYGWISFNEADLSGCSPALSKAQRKGNAVTGGARVIAVRDAIATGNNGGFDGCISLGPTNGFGGVSISGASLTGYAWSSDFGWLDMSRATISIPPSNSINAQDCTIRVGERTCATLVSWSSVGLSSPSIKMDNVEFSQQASHSGITYTMTHGSHTYTVNDGNVEKATDTANATCESGSQWDTQQGPGVCASTNLAAPTVSASAGACGSGKATVTWNLVPTAVSYQVYEGSTYITGIGAGSDPMTYEIDSLAPGSTHTFQVRATNQFGSSPFGSASVTIPSAPCPVGGQVTISARPRIVEYGGSVVLNFDLNGNDPALCTLTGGGNTFSGADLADGTQTVQGMRAATRFTLTCPGGSASVLIEVPPRGYET